MSSLYNYTRDWMVTGQFDWLADNYRVAFLKSGYTFDPDHEFYSDLPGGSVVASSGDLANRTTVNGACDADDLLLGIAGTDVIVAAVIYLNKVGPDSGRLIAYLTGGDLPFTLTGTGIHVIWDNGDNRIFRA